MEKVTYIGKATYNRLITRLDLPQLEITGEIISPTKKKVLKIIPKKSTLNTSLKRFIYNNPKGEFYIGDGKEDKNKIKITKVIKALWGIDDPHMLKVMRDKWYSYYIIDIKIDKPTFVYGLTHANSGTIGNSCMRGKWEYYIGIEEVLKEKLRVVYIRRGDTLMARALLWKIDEAVDIDTGERFKDIIFLDRRYYADEKYEQALVTWAKEKGYWIKRFNSYNEPLDVIDNNGKERRAVMWVEGRGLLRKPYPYMDTFYMILVTDNTKVYFTNSEDAVDYIDDAGDVSKALELRETDGEAVEGELCHYCRRVADDEAVWLYNGAFYCSRCFEERAVYCQDIEDYVDIEDAVKCAFCDEYYYDDTKVSNRAIIDGEETYICDRCAEESFVWSEKYMAFIVEEEAVYCEDCKDYVFYDDEEHIICAECDAFTCKWKEVVNGNGEKRKICLKCYEELYSD